MQSNFSFSINNAIRRIWWYIGYLVMILLVFVYPCIWGLYFSLIRYLRLGSTLDLSSYLSNLISSYLDFILLTPFIVNYLFFWLCVILYIIRSFRLELWHHFSSFFYPFHIRFLQHTFYFSLFRFLHKLNFTLRALFMDGRLFSGYLYRKLSFQKFIGLFFKYTFQKFIGFLFTYPFILTLIFFSFLALELILTKGYLYYGVYMLFFYPLSMAILRCLYSDIFYFFVETVNESDFYYAHWDKVHYPNHFWYSFPMDKLPPTTPEHVRAQLQAIKGQRMRFWYSGKACNDPYYIHLRCQGLKSRALETIKKDTRFPYPITSGNPYVITSGNPKRFCIRFKARYYDIVHVRWYHTSRTLLYPRSPLHPTTLKTFTPTSYMDILTLVNYPATCHTNIQQLAKTVEWPSPASIHVSHPNVLLDQEPRKYINTMESNQVASFRTLADNGVVVGTFAQMKPRVPYSSIMSMQERPDVVLQFNNSAYKTDLTYGIDHKTKYLTNYGRNQMVTPVSGGIQQYIEFVDAYEKHYNSRFNDEKNKQNIHEILKQLRATAHDSATHQHIWASNAHRFPPRWQPPLYADRSFKEEYLTSQHKELFLESQTRIKELYIPSTLIVD